MGRQRNRPQMKEQEKPPEKESNEMKVSNLSDIEFKKIVIRMFKKLRTTRHLKFRLSVDLSTEKFQAGRDWHEIFKVMKSKDL